MSTPKNEFCFVTSFANNAVVVLDCLSEHDLQTGLAVYNKLRDLRDYSDHERAIEYKRIVDLGDLRIALEKVRTDCVNGLRPILHFECHGSRTKGLAVGPSQIELSWAGLESLLRPINVACEGNLGVVMAVCEGMHAIAPLKLHRHAPFLFLIGTQDEIRQGDLADQLPNFYETLFETDNLDRALERVPSCKPFHAERLLAGSVGRFLKNACIGRGKEQRVEHLITSTKWLLGGFESTAQLQLIRANAKAKVKGELTADLVRKYAEPFLGKRKCSFLFEDLVQWIKS
nr:hypothetical protein [Burkholderia ambifaria]